MLKAPAVAGLTDIPIMVGDEEYLTFGEKFLKCHITGFLPDVGVVVITKDTKFEMRANPPMKPFVSEIPGREVGEKLVCSICRQSFKTLEEYRKHHYDTCSGRGS
jgi:hypothetical protein